MYVAASNRPLNNCVTADFSPYRAKPSAISALSCGQISQCCWAIVQSHSVGAAGRRKLGRKDVALHFGECDIALDQAAIGAEDRVKRILPALIGEPLLGGAPVFDEAVAVCVAVL